MQVFTPMLDARVVVEMEEDDDDEDSDDGDAPLLLLSPTPPPPLLARLPTVASDTKHLTVHISINLAGNVDLHSSSPVIIPEDVEDVRGELYDPRKDGDNMAEYRHLYPPSKSFSATPFLFTCRAAIDASAAGSAVCPTVGVNPQPLTMAPPRRSLRRVKASEGLLGVRL